MRPFIAASIATSVFLEPSERVFVRHELEAHTFGGHVGIGVGAVLGERRQR